MNNSLRHCVSLITVLILVLSCQQIPEIDFVPVADITLDQLSIELFPGETATLTATLSPSNATNKTVLWVTGNARVATVSDGQVTAVSVGETTITAKSDDGSKTAICNIIV